jgi:hypothetical protein
VLFGWSLVGFRALAVLAGAATIVVAAAVVLGLLLGAFLVWRRDLLRRPGFPLAIVIAAVLLVPNLVWEAGHGWASIRWFLNPPASATDESRPLYVVNLLLLIVTMPLGLPVLPLHTADRLGVLDARSDYQDEVGWQLLAHDVARDAAGTDVVITRNYGRILGLWSPSILRPRVGWGITRRWWRGGSLPVGLQ